MERAKSQSQEGPIQDQPTLMEHGGVRTREEKELDESQDPVEWKPL